MSSPRKVLIGIAAVGVIVLAAVGWRILPLFTGPALPAGATRPMTALLAPVRVGTSGDELILASVASGETVRVVWPSGFAAWRVGGGAVLEVPWGSVVGREGTCSTASEVASVRAMPSTSAPSGS
jgi:hypothetical protein